VSLTVARTKLMTSLKDLHARWDKVRRAWDDPVVKKFEATYIDPLEGEVRSAITAMEHIHEQLVKARRDCE
jgi:hypothetical protein